MIEEEKNIAEIKKNETEFDYSQDISLQQFQEITESIFIQKQLEKNAWNVSKTADVLGIQRSHLYTKIKKYGLER
jgi:DNA-binding NtrC family response regulator